MAIIGYAAGTTAWQADAATDDDTIAELAQLARRARKNMTAQAELFDPRNHLFGDPAWAIMVFLLESACLGRNASVTDACVASCAAPTTGLRYITALERVGYIKRTADARDRRRSHLALSDEAFEKMRRYFCRATPPQR